MRQHDAELARLGVNVVVVTFQDRPMAEAYAREMQLTWPILLDQSLTLYTIYGMGRGSLWDVYGPESWWEYGKLMLRGRRVRLPAGDPAQLGGDVLIDPQGVVRMHYVSGGPADRPSIASILEVVRRDTRSSSTR